MSWKKNVLFFRERFPGDGEASDDLDDDDDDVIDCLEDDIAGGSEGISIVEKIG